MRFTIKIEIKYHRKQNKTQFKSTRNSTLMKYMYNNKLAKFKPTGKALQRKKLNQCNIKILLERGKFKNFF